MESPTHRQGIHHFMFRSTAVHKKRSWFVPLLLLALILIIIRVVLPVGIQRYVNRTLDRLPGYDGQIGDVDLALIRGAYTIENVSLLRTTGQVPVPLLSSPLIDFSIEWKALLKGKVVGEIHLDRPILNFVEGPSKASSQTSVSSEWLEIVKDLFPFRIDRFEIRDGTVHFRNFHRDPDVDVKLAHVFLVGHDFSNTRTPSEALLAKIEGAGSLEDHATVRVNAELSPAQKSPTFNLDGSVHGLKLASLNDFLKAYANVDAEGGSLTIDTEMAASKGQFRGYVKPLIHDAKIFKVSNDSDGPLQFIWEALVGLTAEIFENQRHEQIGTQVEFSGSFDHPKTSAFETLFGVLYNAFVKALQPGIDDSVELRSPDERPKQK